MLTRQGWSVVGLATALLVSGRVLGAVELYVLGATAGLLVLAAALYTAVVRVRVEVTRELHPPRVHAGSPSRVEIRVDNTSGARSPVLTLHDAVTGTRGAQLGVGPLPPGGVARAAYRLPTDRRGVLRIGPLDVVFGDPFGLTRLELRATGVSELTVYPHVDDILPVPQTTGNDPMAGADHPNALGRSGEDFYALRPYVVGDDLRRVHWLATARHDDLMVRQDELPWQGRSTVLLDLRSEVHTASSLEVAISAAASIVTANAHRDDLIRLLTSDGADLGFSAGQQHVEAVLEHLAGVGAGAGFAFAQVLGRLARTQGGGALVVVTGQLGDDDLDTLRGLRRRFGAVHVVTVHPSAGDPAVAAPTGQPRRAGVIEVTGAAPFPDAWAATVGQVGSRVRRRWLRSPAVVDDDEDRWAHRRRAWV